MSEENANRQKRPKAQTLISVIITAIIAFAYYYYALPAINLHEPSFLVFIAVVLLLYTFISMFAADHETETSALDINSYIQFLVSKCKVAALGLLILIVIFVAGQVSSLTILHAGAYHNLLTVTTGDFTTDVQQASYDEIPMLDEDSARRLGNRKLGELSDMVSQFEISNDYTQINYQGSPVRVACLEYGDFYKWFFNRSEGLPAYVTVDMVTQEADVIRLSDLGLTGIKYSPSELFTRDLMRTLRFRYPTYMFSDPHLEIDDDGQPWWVCPRETRTIGLFGGRDIIGAVLLNACTGESTYYNTADIPTWVDRVYTDELIMQQYDYYGLYVNGWLNSIFGQKGVTVSTDGSNYIAMNDDVYMYTGITSVGSDQSNIGFLLSNQRTKETTYYKAPGAIETSAQESAEGVVQDLGYQATFPLLLNIAGEPTYFMSLKDSSELVKMYAMVNVAQYQIVSTGTTVAECEANYVRLLASKGITDSADDLPTAQTEITGVVDDIRTAVLDGNSYYFIKLKDSDVYYSVSATSDTDVVILNVGDTVTIQVSSSDSGSAILNGYSISIQGAAEDLGSSADVVGTAETTQDESSDTTSAS